MSLVATLNVPGWPGWPVVASLTASITGVVTVLVQFAPAGQLGSPPPVAVAVLALGLTAVAATVTGTVITIGPPVGDAIEHPAKLVVLEQPVSVPPVAVMFAGTVVMPDGSVSLNVIGAVVGPFATATVMV